MRAMTLSLLLLLGPVHSAHAQSENETPAEEAPESAEGDEPGEPSPPEPSPSVELAEPTSGEADAERVGRARALFQSGRQAFVEERYEQALADYRGAYELYRAAQLVFNIAATLDRLGRARGALTHYEAYLEATSSGGGDRSVIPYVRSRIRILGASVERAPTELAPPEVDGAAAHADAPAPLDALPGPDLGGPAALYALGGAALITSVVFAALALDRLDTLEANCRPGEVPICPTASREAADEMTLFAATADVSGIASGVVLAAATAWLIAALSSEGSSARGSGVTGGAVCERDGCMGVVGAQF